MQNTLVDFTLNKLRGNWFYPNLVLIFTPLFSIGYIVLTYRHHKKSAGKTKGQEEANDEEAVNLISAKESGAENNEDEVENEISNEDTNEN